MTGAQLFQLLVTFGPGAVDVIRKLIEVWDKPLTNAEVLQILQDTDKSYEEYIAEAKK